MWPLDTCQVKMRICVGAVGDVTICSSKQLKISPKLSVGPRLGRSRATMHATAERIRSNQLPVRNRHNDPIGSYM